MSGATHQKGLEVAQNLLDSAYKLPIRPSQKGA